MLANARTEAEDILARARLEAENTVTRAQAEAEELFHQLEAELAALRDQTEARMREFQADTNAVWERRGQLLEEIRGMARGLVDLADAAAAREPDEPGLLEALEAKTQAENEPQGSKTEADEVSNGGTREAVEKVAAARSK